MKQGIGLLVYPVKDLARAKALYAALLETEPYADARYYVGFRVGDQEIGLDPNGHKSGMTGPVCYREVADIRKEPAGAAGRRGRGAAGREGRGRREADRDRAGRERKRPRADAVVVSGFTLRPVGRIRSELRSLGAAPKQGAEGAPDAWLELEAAFARALLGIAPGDDLVVITWLHPGSTASPCARSRARGSASGRSKRSTARPW